MSEIKTFVIAVVAFEDLDNRLFRVNSTSEEEAIRQAVNLFYKDLPDVYSNPDLQEWLNNLPDDKEELLGELHQGQISIGILELIF